MAETRFRLSRLDNESLRLLNAVIGYDNRKEKWLDQLEEGKIPKDLEEKILAGGSDAPRLLNKIQDILNKLPTTQQIRDELRNQDIGKATDEELLNLKSGYQHLIEEPLSLPLQSIKDEIKTAFFLNPFNKEDSHISNFMTFEDAERISSELAQSLVAGEFKSKDELINRANALITQPNVLKTGKGKELEKETIPNALNNILSVGQRYLGIGGYRENPNDFIRNIEEILRTRKTVQEKEKAIQDFFTASKAESKQAREQFVRDETGRSVDFFENVAVPDILEKLNERSPLLVKGGQAGGLITDELGSIVSRIQELASQLEEEDASYFIDASYSSMLRKLIEGKQEYSSALGFQRQTEEIDREQKFLSYQNNLNRQLQQDLYSKKLQNSLTDKRIDLEQNKNYKDTSEKAQNIVSYVQGPAQILTALGLSRIG